MIIYDIITNFAPICISDKKCKPLLQLVDIPG